MPYKLDTTAKNDSHNLSLHKQYDTVEEVMEKVDELSKDYPTDPIFICGMCVHSGVMDYETIINYQNEWKYGTIQSSSNGHR